MGRKKAIRAAGGRPRELTVPEEKSDSLAAYLGEIGRYSLLGAEEERALARRFRAGDLDAGHRLVTGNLRFVVKVSYEYRSYGIRVEDLIQEGNIGLMKAVQKFDPDREIRLISYAVWWIRAYVQNYILHNWSLVKLGTTQAQRRLFFSLARTRRELERLGGASEEEVPTEDIARKLRVRPHEVVEMQQRLEGHDLSLDAPMNADDGAATHLDFVDSDSTPTDEQLSERQADALVRRHIGEALARLDPRERFIIENRVMSENPLTFSELGGHFGFSRERARQIEARAREKLRQVLGHALSPLLPEMDKQPA